MPPRKPSASDPVSALLDSADAMMTLAVEVFYRPFQRPQELLTVANEFAPHVTKAKNDLYEQADAALRALVAAGANYTDAEQRVGAIVGFGNSHLEWATRHMGQAPVTPDPEKEPSDRKAAPKWTPQQARLVRDQQAFFRAYQVARGDLLRMWRAMAQRGADPKTPPPKTRPTEDKTTPIGPRSPLPNETTEQPIIDALFRMKAVGLNGLKAIPRQERPTGERLAPIAIPDRFCDGQFKMTLAHMVDLGWLDNGRNHGLRSGYFLTEAGAALATERQRGKPRSR